MAQDLRANIFSPLQDRASLDAIKWGEWGEEARLWGTAALLTTIIVLCIHHMTDHINRAMQCLWSKTPLSVRDSVLGSVDAIETPIVRVFDPAAHACRRRPRGGEERVAQMASAASRRVA